MRTTLFVVLASLLAACGDSGNDKADAAGGSPDAALVDAAPGTPDAAGGGEADAEPAPFELTSPAIPNSTDLLDEKYTCAGANVSPPLAWGPGPAGTKSYAMVFRDKTNPLVHSVIWDISATVFALPEHVENVAMPSVPAGAEQAHGYDGHTYGYLGPCPQGSVHEYEFELIAVDVASLPGVTTSNGRDMIVTALGQHALASTKLATRSNASN